MMKNRLNILSREYMILLFILLAVVYWKWWSGGVRVATDFPVVSLSDLKTEFDIPQVWFLRGSQGFGGYSVFTLWAWPMDFIAGIFSNLGFTFGILERILFVIPILLIGVSSIWNLLHDLKLSKASKFLATFFYLTNTYILLLIDGGQLGIGLAFAWFPASYFLFIKSIRGKFENKIAAGMGLWLLGVFDIRFVYVLGILFAFRFIYEFTFSNKREWGRLTFDWIKSGLTVSLIFVALNAYWLLPLIKYPLLATRIADLTKSSNLDFTQLKNSITLLQPQWYENIFGKIPPFRKEFLLIPILVFLAPILKRKNREVWFWTFVAAVSVFLTKGNNSPLSGVYPWLFNHMPGFSLFRDSTKFFFLVALSYSVLIAFTVDVIIKKFFRFKLVFPILVLGYFLLLLYPAYTDKMTGTFSSPRYESEYFTLSNIFENDSGFGRIFWIPSRTPLGFASRLHSSLEARRLESLRPFAISTVGTYETQNFIREGNYMGELFDIAGIKYVAYPYLDPKRDDMSKEKVDYYNAFLSQIAALPWISKKISDFPVPVFETKKNEDKFFLSQNTYFVVGSDGIYSDIKNLGGKFSNNALIFVEENAELMSQIEKVPQAKILLYNKTLVDLFLSFASQKDFISPSAGLGFSPDETGWWKREAVDLVSWRDFLQQKYGIDNLDFDYGQGWAVAEGSLELKIGNEKLKGGDAFYARVMSSGVGGTIGFYQGDTKIGEVDTKIKKPERVQIKLTGSGNVPDKYFEYDKAEFGWVKIGNLVADREITIKTAGDINVVNSLAVISGDEQSAISQKIEFLTSEGKILDWTKLSDDARKRIFSGESKAKVFYKTLSPTHYRVWISGLSSPTTLFFSETFDTGWQLNSESPYPLYSLINGFTVVKDGKYDLYFSPQKYVLPGLVVSGVTLTSCIMFLLWRKSKKSSGV